MKSIPLFAVALAAAGYVVGAAPAWAVSSTEASTGGSTSSALSGYTIVLPPSAFPSAPATPASTRPTLPPGYVAVPAEDAPSKNFCYYGGKSYSIGSRRGSEICAEGELRDFTVSSDGSQVGPQNNPPHWEAVERKPSVTHRKKQVAQ